ncbi:hypothetical protein HF086_001094 [Spodoptera exigua]|uniref:Uncharacterized protein n=1 Tax=Spodoptera exigua TaxID=7107 RepID=A0A922M1Y6_SPOEX|nr:hypothetical protein HF086_001094 [Spodoptera exigua]
MVVGFKRVWDSSCPRIWDQWVDDNGTTWIIQDLPPEDDEKAIKILVENLCPDETLCSLSKIVEDPVSTQSISDFWRGYLAQRMSLACYELKDGNKKLVALNNVYNALKVVDDKVDAFKYLGMSQILYALGLVVCREYRGAKLGARILAASATRAGFTTIGTITLKELAENGLNFPRDENRNIKVMVKRFDD